MMAFPEWQTEAMNPNPNSVDSFATALRLLTPEIMVVAAIVFCGLWNLFFPRQKDKTPWVAIGFLVAACCVLSQQFGQADCRIFQGLFTADKLTAAFGLLSCLVGVMVIAMSMGYEHHFGDNAGEFYAILLGAVLSVMVLAGATDLILLFLGLETLTICCVLLSGFAKRDRKSNEASLKYLLSTAATTATFLYGLTFVYGLTGSTNYVEIHSKIYPFVQSPSLVVILAIVLLLSAVGFKLSMVPFHMWTPDVYEGAPTPVTAYLSVGSKLGGFVVAIRLLSYLFDQAAPDWSLILGALAVLSMVVGNFVALAQTSLKRMLAYSSIAHVGYLLIGIVANSAEGLTALLFYFIVYGFMNLGAFTGAIMFSNETGSDNIDELAGLVRKRPWLAVMLSICLLNLAGLPVPPAGFLAKVFIFWAGIQMYSTLGYFLVAAALITSVPAVYYYTRVVIVMVVKDPSPKVEAMPDTRPRLADPQAGLFFAMAVSILGIIAGSFAVNSLVDFSGKAVSSLGKAPSVSTVPSSTH